MNIGNMKNMVILRDIPSNMVEEAIVIFKPNIKIEQGKKEEKKKENIKVGAKGKELYYKRGRSDCKPIHF